MRTFLSSQLEFNYTVRGFPWDYEILPIPKWFKEILAGTYYYFPPHPIRWHEGYFWDPDEWLTNASLSVLENFMPNVLFLHLPMLDLWQHFYRPGTPIAIDTLKHADEQIGRVVDKLEELGIYEQTTVFLTSDHGFTKVIKYADFAAIFLTTFIIIYYLRKPHVKAYFQRVAKR